MSTGRSTEVSSGFSSEVASAELDLAPDGGVNSGLPERGVSIVEVTGAGAALELRSLSLATPDGSRTLFRDVSLTVAQGEHLHII